MFTQIENGSKATDKIDPNQGRYQLHEGACFHREVGRDLAFGENPNGVDKHRLETSRPL